MIAPEGRRWRPSRKVLNALAIVILALVLFFTWQAVPRVPRRIVILAGPSGSSYFEYAERYGESLREKGLAAEVVETEGSLENLTRLAAEGRAAVGFAQAGVETELEGDQDLEGLVSLGSVAFEPIWIFHREGQHVRQIRDFEGMRLGLGRRGGGSRAITELLLLQNGLADSVETVPVDLTEEGAARALTSGEVDGILLVGDLEAPLIAQLLFQPGVAPGSLLRTGAYARRNRELAELTLPHGAIDLARDIPDTDLKLIATATNLVARDDLHPAAVGIVLEAAREIHRPASLFADEGVFPTTAYTSLPVSSAAVSYLQEGQGLVYRLLPFWLAGLLSWLAQLLTPFVTVALFLYQILPRLLHMRFESRHRHFFKRLERLEKARGAGANQAQIQEALEKLVADLDRLDRDSVGLPVPRGMTSPYFELRQAIHDMRDRLGSL